LQRYKLNIESESNPAKGGKKSNHSCPVPNVVPTTPLLQHTTLALLTPWKFD